MQLTKKSGYGLIAALELAANIGGDPIPAAAIAAKYGLPVPFVGKILHQLKGAGLISAKQGRSGGYVFALEPSDVSVRSILEALGESLDLVGCIDVASDCLLASVCPTKTVWSELDKKFKGLFESLSLHDIIATDRDEPMQG